MMELGATPCSKGKVRNSNNPLAHCGSGLSPSATTSTQNWPIYLHAHEWCQNINNSWKAKISFIEYASIIIYYYHAIVKLLLSHRYQLTQNITNWLNNQILFLGNMKILWPWEVTGESLYTEWIQNEKKKKHFLPGSSSISASYSNVGFTTATLASP